MRPSKSRLVAARALGRSDRRYAHAALTAHTTTGARLVMMRMAADVLGIKSDPPDTYVDALADAYWEGIGEGDWETGRYAKHLAPATPPSQDWHIATEADAFQGSRQEEGR